jgi:hypothetical protein
MKTNEALRSAGKEINDETDRIIHDEMARVKANTARSGYPH